MNDKTRETELGILVDLYSPQDYTVVMSRMPTELEDPNGTEFEEYYDFIQALFKLKGGYMYMNPNDLEASLLVVRTDAAKFNYPTSQLDML